MANLQDLETENYLEQNQDPGHLDVALVEQPVEEFEEEIELHKTYGGD